MSTPDWPHARGEAADLVRQLDWARTPLGPTDTWPRSLRNTVDLVLESPLPMLILWGPEFIQLYNDAYRPLFTSRHPEAMGRPSQESWPEFWDANKPKFNKVLQRGESIFLKDMRCLTSPRGYPEQTYVTIAFSPIRDDDGMVGGVLVTLIDTTQRVLREQEDRELLARNQVTIAELRRLLELAPSEICVLRGPTHVCELANAAFRKFAGNREIIGLTMREAFPDVAGQGFFRLLDQVYSSGQPFVGREMRMVLRHGPDNTPEEHYLDFVYQPIRDASGRVSGILLHGNDVTSHVRAKQALREADRRKNEFLATLAHELRNPLAPIRNATRLAKMPTATPAHTKWSLDVIERQVEHMARLLDDLLEASRISRGTFELRKERIELTSALFSAIETAQPLIEARRHILSVDTPPEPVWLDADPVRLAQVFSNLLHNAAKYTDPGGQIHIKAQREGKWICVCVRDTGIGISPEMLPRVFEMFSQAGSAIDRAQGGLGIGLALVKGLVDMHGGNVEVRSEGVNKGSEFIVRLPVVEPTGETASENQPSPETCTNPDIRRVLVADDNHDAAESLAVLLQLKGHEVEVAHNGRDALRLAARFQPDVALLDIGMPELNGYDLAKAIRATDWGKDIRLVAVTGWGQDDVRERALRAGFDQHLTKPVDERTLTRVLSGGNGATSMDA